MERHHPHQSDTGNKPKPRRTARPPLLEAQAGVAMVDIHDICGLARVSKSYYYAEVQAGRAPAPLNYGPRCARWPLSVVRAWLIERRAAGEAAQAKRLAKPAVEVSA